MCGAGQELKALRSQNSRMAHNRAGEQPLAHLLPGYLGEPYDLGVAPEECCSRFGYSKGRCIL